MLLRTVGDDNDHCAVQSINGWMGGDQKSRVSPGNLKRPFLKMIVVVIAAATATACSDIGQAMLNQSDRDALKTLHNGTKALIGVEELRRLSAVVRYQRFENGTRTWLLDSATGAACVLLTSDLDWESEKVKSSACQQVLGVQTKT